MAPLLSLTSARIWLLLTGSGHTWQGSNDRQGYRRSAGSSVEELRIVAKSALSPPFIGRPSGNPIARYRNPCRPLLPVPTTHPSLPDAQWFTNRAARADRGLSGCAKASGDLAGSWPICRPGRGSDSRVYRAGLPEVPDLRHPGERLCQGPLCPLRPRLSGGLLLQRARRLSLVNTRRMDETAAHLVDHVFPRVPVRQWVLSLPKRLRYFLHQDARLVNAILGF